MAGLSTPGVYVLGMHRSGTSVVAGLLDRLGLDPGPRASMLSPDEFNSDGYWEQRPVVEWHDSILAGLGGFASAPPTPPSAERIEHLSAARAGDASAMLATLYQSTWFMKDPRQCLLLGLWSALRGNDELAVVVSRDPTQVIRSLQRRNAYSHDLAAALWERYSRDLLIGLAGRPCLFLRYEQLTTAPQAAVAALVEALERHARDVSGRADPAAAVALVRAARPPEAGDDGALSAGQRRLDSHFADLAGYHPCFVTPDTIAALTPSSVAVLERRRARLNRLRPFLRATSDCRARVDRIPASLRRGSERLRTTVWRPKR